jgi:hypothetical protein
MSAAHMKGPCGAIFDEIRDAVDANLEPLLCELPMGLTHDPIATPRKITVKELSQVLELLDRACELLERINKREAKYSLNNGWLLPEDRAALN